MAIVRNLVFSFVGVGAMIALSNPLHGQEPTKLTYDEHVKPILQQHCSSCHSANRKESDLDVMNYTALMQGGASGEVISPGSVADSFLYQLITHNESPEMPPSGKIPDPEIKTIADWIELGALENAGSKPKKMKAKVDLGFSGDALTRPEKIVEPLRMPVEPAVKTPRSAVNSMATSPWAKVVALAAPRQVLLYSTESLELLGILPFEEGVAHQLRFSRNGSLLLGAGGKDGKLGTTVLWDLATGERVTQVGSELDVILASDISPAHDLIAIGGPSKLVKVLDVSDGSVRFEIKKHNEWVTAIEFSPDGKLLATGDRNGAIHVWETASGAELYALAGHTAAITGLSFRLDGKILATASEDTTIRTWEMEKGGAIKSWGAHEGGTTAIQFLRDGNLASSGRDKLCKVWNQDGSVIRQTPGMTDVVVAMACCNETNRLIAADWNGQICVWNPDGAEVGKLVANPPSLAERLAAAQELLANANNRLSPANTELQVSTRKLDDLKANLAAKQTERAELDSKQAKTNAEIAACQQKIATLTEQQKNAEAELQQLKSSLPLVSEALEKTTAASAAMANDQELIQSKSQLEAKKQQIEQRLAELETQMPLHAQELKDTQGLLDTMTQQVTQEVELLAAHDKLIDELKNQVTPLEQEVNQKTTVMQTISTEVETATSQVARWQGEIEFVAQLKALQEQLANVQQTIEQKQSVEQDLQSKIQELESQLQQAREQTSTVEKDAESIRQQILKLRSRSS